MTSVGGYQQNAGAGTLGSPLTAPAQFATCEDALAASIVRIQRELEEAQAQIAVYEAERAILLRERDDAREALREIAAADWRTSGELRGMARRALEAIK